LLSGGSQSIANAYTIWRYRRPVLTERAFWKPQVELTKRLLQHVALGDVRRRA